MYVLRNKETGEFINPNSTDFALSPNDVLPGADNWQYVLSQDSEVDHVDGYDTLTLEAALESIVDSLEPRDFAGFADAVRRFDAVLGETVALHAEAADGNSPDLPDWIGGTMDDYRECDAETVEAARLWWAYKYE